MRPLIVSATQEEIALSIPFFQENNIPYLITGVGMVATTFALTQQLTNNTFDIIINVGIAGALNRTIAIGDVVEITEDIFSELGAEDDKLFIPIADLGFGQSTYTNNNKTGYHTGLTQHTGITVNRVHGALSSIDDVKNLFPKAEIESMEGASIFYVSTQLNIPSIQVRAISNYVEKRDKSTWDIPLAVKNVNNWLTTFLLKHL